MCVCVWVRELPTCKTTGIESPVFFNLNDNLMHKHPINKSVSKVYRRRESFCSREGGVGWRDGWCLYLTCGFRDYTINKSVCCKMFHKLTFRHLSIKNWSPFPNTTRYFNGLSSPSLQTQSKRIEKHNFSLLYFQCLGCLLVHWTSRTCYSRKILSWCSDYQMKVETVYLMWWTCN